MNVVIVESPAKAKTINKYLGPDFVVLASYGHIRDLPSKDGSVQPDADFAMTWQVDNKSAKHVNEIVKAVKGAKNLFLASDPDREGEAIAWHVLEVLGDKKALDGVTVKRVVFNEITKSAVKEAFNHPRDIDMELVDAYLARRALDYLVGFTLSPVLWRKLPGSRSAGRVQSVALRIICAREMEIELFDPQEYWTVEADFTTPGGETVRTHLTHLNDKKVGKMDIGTEAAANAAVATIQAGAFTVTRIETKQTRRNPAPPFTTSTLQQEAARKLYFAARRTMQTAQRLYEGVSINGETVGLITYMRTDGVQMSGEAIEAARTMIGQDYGSAYVPDQVRTYTAKSKNAQEAHEAIRPTDMTRKPEQVKAYLDDDQLYLYELIWKRAIASQVASAILDQVAVDMDSDRGDATVRVTGSVVAFDGFFRIYREGGDDTENEHRADERDKILPPMKEGESMALGEILPEQHFTQPPPRYSEASLVKKLEELGIGRPSTYASILSVLQDRKYVVLDARRFIPEDRGRLVTAFLESFFARYVEYDFTADLEDKLDEIAAGNMKWRDLLSDFWLAFRKSADDIAHLRVREVLDALNELLGPHFFHDNENGKDPRACPSCDTGQISLKLGKFGAFIGCSDYPNCKYTRALVASNDDEIAAGMVDGQPKVLGQDPKTGKDVTLRKGPYGFYLQRGEEEEIDGKKVKPKRGSIPQGTQPQDVDMAKALDLLSLPRDVGEHPETREMIKAGIGQFGPYLLYRTVYYSLKEDDPLAIGLNRAVTLIAESPKKPPKHMGDHPEDGKPIMLQRGRWGYFVKHGNIKMNMVKGTEEEDVTFDMALAAITAKREKDGKPVKKKAAKKKKTAKKKSAKKKTAKKKPALKKKEEAPVGE